MFHRLATIFSTLTIITIAALWIFALSTPKLVAQQWLPGGAGQPAVCAYNSSPPTFLSGLYVYIQCDNTGKLIVSNPSSFSGAVYPSGGAANSSNGLGNTDANAFTTTLSGPSIASWATPSACTLPGSFGSYALFQCLLTLANTAVIFPVNITPSTCSGVTLATGGTAQNLFSASSTLHGFKIQNNDTTHDEDVWYATTGTASVGGTNSFRLAAAPAAATTAQPASYVSEPGEGINTALSWIAATTGHTLSCTTW